MSRLFSRYATPFITGLFLVSLISGGALFFHIGPSGLHGMHEWLSMVLIVPFALHLWKNWRPMTSYFKHAPMAIALAVSLAAAGVFLLPSDTAERRAGPPPFALAGKLMQAQLTTAAPALGTTPEALTMRLQEAGFTVAPGQTLNEIAAASGQERMALMAALAAE